MSQENFYASKMVLKTDDELKNYISNQDHFQEEAVLAAVLELEKRGLHIDGAQKIKEELAALKTVEKIEAIEDSGTFENAKSTTIELPELYSTRFIYIFGALFSVFGGGVLMALNFMTLNNKKAAKNTILASLGYNILLTYLVDAIGATSIIFSLATSLLGVYLLYYFFWNKQVSTDINYKEKDIWKPIVIGLLIAMPLAYLMLKSGYLPQ